MLPTKVPPTKYALGASLNTTVYIYVQEIIFLQNTGNVPTRPCVKISCTCILYESGAGNIIPALQPPNTGALSL